MAGNTAGPDDSITVAVGVPTAELPTAHRNPVLRWNGADLVVRAYYRDLCLDGSSQSPEGDLGADSARITESDGDPRT
jgi:hypothetical protein